MATLSSSTVGGKQVQTLLDKWLDRARTNQLQHYAAAEYFSRLHQRLGIPATILSVIVGSTVFASLQKQISVYWQITVGVLSIVAAILAGMQTYLRFSEIAEKHRSSAAAYSAIRHRLEVLITFEFDLDLGSIRKIVDDLEKEMDSLATNSPNPPQKVWQKIKNEVKNEDYFLKRRAMSSTEDRLDSQPPLENG